MTVIRPFYGIHPTPALAGAIAALPYDVYHRAEAAEIVKQHPLSFLQIDRAETQFPPTVDMYSDEVYARARDTFYQMCADGSFVQDDKPCFYLYALTMKGRTQTGIVGCASIDDYQNGIIRKHENTRAEKELDRIRHIDALSAQTGPIFLTYRSNPDLHQIIQQAGSQTPLFDFVSEDEIRHQVWKIADSDICHEITHLFQDIPSVYIADGHHRAASAVKVGLKRRAEHPDYTGEEEFNFFLSVLFSEDELKIYDYNRVVEDHNGHTPAELLDALQTDFQIAGPSHQKSPRSKGSFSMFCDGNWYQLTARPHLYTGDFIHDLDVSILQDHVLRPLLGIEDPTTDSRIRFVGGIYGVDRLVQLVQEKPERIAFAMYPTSMEELLSVADAHQLMPPKSTWFEPKLRSGLLIHKFENEK